MANPVIKARFIGGALWKPKKTEEDKVAKFSASLVLEPGEEKKLEAAVKEAVDAKWNGKPPSGTQNWVIRKGEDEEFERSFGKFYVNPKANSINKNGDEMGHPPCYIRKADGALYPVEASDDIIYPGCYVAAELSVYCYDGDRAKNIKPGISCSLNKVLFLRDGERLSSQTSADSAFAGFESEVEEAVAADDVW